MVDVAANYRRIVDSMSAAAAKSGRDPSAIRLLAAAKAQSVAAIRAAVTAGVKLLGENYAQEALEKKPLLVDASVEWHMIGHLQRNKVKTAMQLFDVIESLDSEALALELDKEAARRGGVARTFVEVNLAGEESKSGVENTAVEPLLEAIAALKHIKIEGLMSVPPFREDLEDIRPYFCELRQLRDRLSDLHLPNVELRELSMGMTHDYTVAIEEGATIVRVGTALFGPRQK